MLVGIATINLYTGMTATGSDSHAAFEWMTENEVPFTSLHYADPVQHQSVFEAISTWFPERSEGVTEFPFVTYEERHDDYSTKVQCLYGLGEITSSNLVELNALTASQG